MPLSFEVHGMGIPVFNHGGDGVHGIDPFDERHRDSSHKEVDEGVFISNFTEGDVVLEPQISVTFTGD